MTFSTDFLLHKFLQHAGYPKYKPYSKVYEAGCPICREGKSWGRKRRLYFILKDNKICCHNCGWFGSPVDFIIEVANTTFKDLIDESKTFSGTVSGGDHFNSKTVTRKESDTLPDDSINLFDSHQLIYHKNNYNVKECLNVIAKRRLDVAVNRPRALYISLTDFTHKNRLIIPFYDENGKIVFYQTRTIHSDDDKKFPKYLSKIGAEKSLFNVDNVDPDSSNVFIFEGPIDACFMKNGVAVAGIQERSHESFTSVQKKQLNKFILHNKIWVLDSQWQDTTALNKTSKLIERGHSVFIWPEKYGRQFKDFNHMCTSLNINEIPESFILQHTYSGNKADGALNKMKLLSAS